jgi:hypothetical protein|tara:strand:+ start:832 stop:1335 length:504 start_codon:yes stop_codon:yes gene_type:complete
MFTTTATTDKEPIQSNNDKQANDETDKTEPPIDNIDSMLERERQRNKTDNWIKLDKTAKLQRLHLFAETYGKQHSMPTKDIKLLKSFFNSCLDKNKLAKSKDVVYNKEDMKIISIPSLHFNQLSHNFTLKLMDTKRVSTLKSLTPKRIMQENDETIPSPGKTCSTEN